MAGAYVWIYVCIGKFLLCSTSQVSTYTSNLTLTSGFLAGSKINKVDGHHAYRAHNDRFLPYMIELRRNCLNVVNTSTEAAVNFKDECLKQSNAFTAFHKLVYYVLCQKNASLYENLDRLSSEACDTLEISGQVCQKLSHVVLAYMKLEQSSVISKKQFNNSQYLLSYKEFLMEDISFCSSITCPSINKTENTEDQTGWISSLYECMPNWCKLTFYGVFCTDIILSFAIAFSNGFVLIVGVKHQFINYTNGCFTMSLALADAMVGMITHPCTVHNFYEKYTQPLQLLNQTENKAYLIFTGIVQTTSMASSLFTLILISIFRHYALTRPFSYRYKENIFNQRAKRSIVGIWFLSATLGLVTCFRIVPGDKFEVHPMGMTLSKQMIDYFVYHAVMFASMIILWVIYFKIRYQNQDRKLSVALTQHKKQSKMMKKKKRPSQKTLKAMIMLFTVCYLPLIITQAFHKHPALDLENHQNQFSVWSNSAWNIVMLVASRLVVLNSLLNSIIYNCKNDVLRKELNCMFGMRRNEQLTNLTYSSTRSY